MRTARAAAAVADPGKISAMTSTLAVPPLSLDMGIRKYYKRNQVISTVDIMQYACRVVDRCLIEMGFREGERKGGYPGVRRTMRARVEEVWADLLLASASEGISE
jgi:hypothetical protein